MPLLLIPPRDSTPAQGGSVSLFGRSTDGVGELT